MRFQKILIKGLRALFISARAVKLSSFNKRKLLLLLLPLTFSVFAQAHEKQWPEKRLRQAWSDAQKFTSRQMTLDASQISQLAGIGIKVGSEDRIPTFYFAQGETPNSGQAKTLGVIFFVDEYGANGKMEITVAIDPNGKTKKVDIWDHAENSAVAKDEFLKQFLGKTSKDSFVPDKDYKPIPDALKASQAVASAVRKALNITSLVFEKK